MCVVDTQFTGEMDYKDFEEKLVKTMGDGETLYLLRERIRGNILWSVTLFSLFLISS